jgi:esterase/lipase superfamily enzyme
VERFGLLGTLEPWISQGEIQVISCDSVPGRVLLERDLTAEELGGLLYRFDVFVYHELVPWIQSFCNSSEGIIAAGASLGALYSLTSVCRHPDVFVWGIGLSGKYDLGDYLDSAEPPLDFHYASPLHFLPYLEDSNHLSLLRQRFIHLVCGRGRAERPEYAFRVATTLGRKAIPNFVEVRGLNWHHDWASWRAALPTCVERALRGERNGWFVGLDSGKVR